MNRLYQDYYKQWIAETVLMLSDTIQLTVKTRKVDKAVITVASCGHLKDSFISHMIYSDFMKRYAYNTYPRVTYKVIQSQHDSIDIDSIVKDAKEFYQIV